MQKLGKEQGDGNVYGLTHVGGKSGEFIWGLQNVLRW